MRPTPGEVGCCSMSRRTHRCRPGRTPVAAEVPRPARPRGRTRRPRWPARAAAWPRASPWTALGRPRVPRARAASGGPVRPGRARGVAAWRGVLAAPAGQPPDQAGQDTEPERPGPRRWIGGRGVDRTRPDLVADPVQTIRARLDLLPPGAATAARTANSSPGPPSGRWRRRVVTLRSSAERRPIMPRDAPALHRTAADAHGGGDLGFGQVGIVPEHDRLALLVGQVPQRRQPPRTFRAGPVPRARRSACPARRFVRSCPPSSGAAARTWTGSPPPAEVGQPRFRVPQAPPGVVHRDDASWTTSSAVPVPARAARPGARGP